MTREQKASILGEVIRFARQGMTQADIARNIGINPSKVYKICKKYGIRTKRMIRKDKEIRAIRPEQYFLPL